MRGKLVNTTTEQQYTREQYLTLFSFYVIIEIYEKGKSLGIQSENRIEINL